MSGNDFKQLEDLVRSLPLRSPSPGLDERILSVCQSPPLGVGRWWLGTAAGLFVTTLVVAAVVTVTSDNPTSEPVAEKAPPAERLDKSAPAQPKRAAPSLSPRPVETPSLSPAPPVAPALPAEVMGRHIFYNGSKFDGEDPVADRHDDAAIAPDKAALLPGETASLANYTSFDRGINGIMVDIAGLPSDTVLGEDDFRFRMGNNNHPAGWSAAPSPLIVMRGIDEVGMTDGERPTSGDGSDASSLTRITLIWPDGVIDNTWLQVTVRATAATGLGEDDVFYFGNAVGESGNSTTDAQVNAHDMAATRRHYGTLTGPGAVASPLDINRDSQIDDRDTRVSQSHPTHFLNALKLITVPDR